MKSGRWRRRIYSSPQEVTSEAKVTFTAQLPVYNTHDRTTEYYKGAFKKITNTNSATKYLIPYTVPVILLFSVRNTVLIILGACSLCYAVYARANT
ncbi:hypothetical protein KQX54_012519 [Cotesia glomerata]|uniref:Uncharacterized protein n=1 Tax=Cotesia glomerata TaxID=32391 RepID=A0AAV7IN57_COTGL|nr:hypothetical protein KQX54_012519 [Cotesia glomerata]